MTRVLVVGGGPAGLAAAYRLSASAEHSVRLVERAPQLGGLAAGFRHGDATLDFGPHRLHAETHPLVMADLRLLLGDELERKKRHGRIWLNGQFLPYPVGPRTLLELGLPTLARLGWGLARAAGARDVTPGVTRSVTYEAAVTRRVGRPLYELFYAPYAEKVWGLPGAQIAGEQADKRVNQRGARDLLKLALGRAASGGTFFYPRAGFGQIPAAYAAALATRPHVRLECNASVERITRNGTRVQAVDGQQVDHLVWSAPLPELVKRLDPPPLAEVQKAAAGLRFRAVVLLYVTLDKARVGSADTYYFPERHVPFNRVVEQKNFSAALVPPNRTVLGMDISCDADDQTWNASDAQLVERVLPALRAARLVNGPEMVEAFTRRFRHAYPIYDLDSAPRLEIAQNYLDNLENVWLIGRQGLYLHNNTHHSLLMGYRAADAITRNGRAGWPQALAEFAEFRVAD